MGRRKSKYLVVARRKAWTLAYPRHAWERLDVSERQDVIQRQQTLFDKMERASARRKRSKVQMVQNVA